MDEDIYTTFSHVERFVTALNTIKQLDMASFMKWFIGLFLGLYIGWNGAHAKERSFDEELRHIGILSEILIQIQDEYVNEDKTSTEQLIQGAIDGMLSSLDRYSVFLSPQEAKTFSEQTEGSFQGLGIQVDFVDGWLTVIEPIPGTPAAEAGLIGGDRIVEIDGQPTKDIGFEKASLLLQGEIGTEVMLLIARHGEPSLLSFTLTRARIETLAVEPGEQKMLDDRIGYIRLRNFTQDAAVELEQSIRALQNQGMQSLIFDLRDNVGGIFDVAVDICDLFFSEGVVVVSQKDRNGRITTYETQKPHTGTFLLAVLVNDFTASSSEIVAGCLQDHRRAVLVGPAGQKTFGKGSVQSLIELVKLPGAALKITTAKYYTPHGRSIDDIQGLTPDIQVPVTESQRVAMRSQNKMGYVPSKFLNAKQKPMPISPPSFVEENEENDPQQDVFDMELYYAFITLKGAGIFQSGGRDPYNFVYPRN